ncbi:LysR family transcriptional regulator, partial [Pseudomonas aeruginosa]|nr:LysR family transcriptional regulator [Pseudomonas aeruginosa]
IGLLPLRAVSAGHAVLPKNAGLPAVDVFEVALLHRPAADPMVKALARVLSRVLAEDTRSRPAFEK